MAEKAPRSEAQINASRINGARSKGPTTEAGKAISAGNSLLHGLTANSVVLPHEDPEKFNALFAEAIHEFAPATMAELQAVEQLTVTTWKLRRLWNNEKTSQNESRLDSLHQHETRLDRLYNRTLARLERLQARRVRPAPLGSPENVFSQNEPENYHPQEVQ